MPLNAGFDAQRQFEARLVDKCSHYASCVAQSRSYTLKQRRGLTSSKDQEVVSEDRRANGRSVVKPAFAKATS